MGYGLAIVGVSGVHYQEEGDYIQILIYFNFQFKKLNIHNLLTYMTNRMQPHTLALLSLPGLNDFIFSICANHFESISANPNHPLFNHIIFNNLKRSFRVTNACSVCFPEIALTQKRSKTFFQYFMRYFNNGNIYPIRARPFAYYRPCNWRDTAM